MPPNARGIGRIILQYVTARSPGSVSRAPSSRTHRHVNGGLRRTPPHPAERAESGEPRGAVER